MLVDCVCHSSLVAKARRTYFSKEVMQVLRYTFFWKFDAPRNANNVTLYTFVVTICLGNLIPVIS